MATDEQIQETIDTAKRVAKARRQGDEAMAQLLTRKLQESWPPYATPERCWFQALFDNTYREYNARFNTNTGMTL